MAKKKLKPYSVLLLYPDYCTSDYGQDTYYAFVTAGGVEQAVAKAQRRAARFVEGIEAEDMYPLLVINGHRRDQLTE